MQKQSLIYILSVALLSGCGGSILTKAPVKVDPKARYVFYSHGSAVYRVGATGAYNRMMDSLAANGLTVISEQRNSADLEDQAVDKITKEVKLLVAAGIPAKNISIAGFSRGAVISYRSAAKIGNVDIRVVLLAGCNDEMDDRDIKGHILSMYDTDDSKGYASCANSLENNKHVTFKEKSYNSGKGHKLFKFHEKEDWHRSMISWLKE
ncbi:MAG: hypothetical protein OEX12_02780 [Gammaproteobacteria bacterium]|nr:hypothetical protein [Gammaproteobacteria bacterium]